MTEALKQAAPSERALGSIGQGIEYSITNAVKINPQFEATLKGGDEYRKEVVFDPSEMAVKCIVFKGPDGKKYALSSNGEFAPKGVTEYSKFCFGNIINDPESKSFKIDTGIVVEYLSVGEEILGSIKFIHKDNVTTNNQAALDNSVEFAGNFTKMLYKMNCK